MQTTLILTQKKLDTTTITKFLIDFQIREFFFQILLPQKSQPNDQKEK